MTIKDKDGREWVLVPREATAKMLLAPDSQCSHGEICAAMIAAAPELAEALKETRDCVVSCLNVEENASYSRPERAEYYRELLAKVDAALAKAGAV